MTRALITGINGFAGSYLVEFLLSKGYRVLGIVQHLKNAENIRHLITPSPLFKVYKKLLLAVLVTGAFIVRFNSLSILILIPIVTIIYTAALFVTRTFDYNDRSLVKQVFKRELYMGST